MKRNPIALAIVAVLAAGMAFAQTAAVAANPRAAVRQRMMKKLDLTADQKTQIKTILQQARTAALPVRTQMQQNRQALTAAVKANNTAQIQTLAAAQGSLQGQIVAIRTGAEAKLYALLTPDQQASYTQMQEKIKQLRQQLKAL